MHCYTLARRPICAALFGAFGLSVAPAFADSLPQGATPPTLLAASTRGDAALLDPVTVTATRTATAASRTAASVSVITDEDLEEQQAANIKDALRYEPGVTVRRTAYRPGSAALGGGRDGDSSINIRGL
ncbi:TonB-dependent receptor plug domain-containing protein, partial [Burkholderia ubonensis]